MDHNAQLRHPGALEQRAESIGDGGKKWGQSRVSSVYTVYTCSCFAKEQRRLGTEMEGDMPLEPIAHPTKGEN